MPSSATMLLRSSRPDRTLTRVELSEFALELGEREDLWRSLVHHDADERFYVQLHRDPNVDIWLICWTNQQDTGFHDHDVSAGAVHVCSGDLVEDRYELTDAGLRSREIDRRAGSTFDFDASHVHRLRHPEGTVPAVSIHAYSPALWRMGYYDVDESGLLRRTSISYAEETAAA
ncbi:MAG: cysteine dioxygenase [Actinomycetia bacterium]|nr:cysteine dioxygenase [Actinomycetes bacterium]